MKRSLALETTWFVLLTIVLVVIVGVFGQHILARHNHDLVIQKAQSDIGTYALALQRQVGFYQRLLKGISKREDVYDLLEFGDQNESFLWAQNYRKLLPDTVGLSLINHGGEIQGNPDSLLVGPECRADILSLSRDKIIPAPAIHYERAGFEHFDLFAAVNDVGGERLGYVFASFRLTAVQDLLDEMTHRGHVLTVETADHTPIASTDRLANTTGEVFELALPVSGTDWRITLKYQSTGMEDVYVTLIAVTSVLALIIGAIVVLLSRHLSRGLLREFFGIRTALEQIAEGSDTSIDIQPYYREAAPLIAAVQDVSKRIQTQKETLRQLSETDSLTGLLNRRRFTPELEKAWALANRKTKVDVMTLDIDHFKKLNDQLGHAAGDQVLVALAGCLNECARSTDVVARLGGDEFVILLIDSDGVAGQELFKRLSTCFDDAQTKLPIDIKQHCTLSAGLISIDRGIDADAEGSLQRSDKALYCAKQGGKNRIQC